MSDLSTYILDTIQASIFGNIPIANLDVHCSAEESQRRIVGDVDEFLRSKSRDIVAHHQHEKCQQIHAKLLRQRHISRVTPVCVPGTRVHSVPGVLPSRLLLPFVFISAQYCLSKANKC